MNDSPGTGFVETMRSQLKKWDADLGALAKEGDKASAEAHERIRAGLEELRVQREAAQVAFSRICTAGETAGSQLHASMQDAWSTMRAGLDRVADEVRKP